MLAKMRSFDWEPVAQNNPPRRQSLRPPVKGGED